MFQLLRSQGADALAAACSLACESKAYGLEYLEDLLGVPAPRPQVTEPLKLPGIPLQSEIDRGLAAYEAYAVGVNAYV